MQDKLKLIREKVIEANPEIVELKFGCEVEYEKKPFRMIYFGVVTTIHKSSICVLHNRLIPDFIVKERDIRKIIGRPITLADVLLAIKTGIYIREDGSIYSDEGVPLDLHYTGVSWNLKDNNLNNQSEECIDFLYELLKANDK